MWTVLLFVLVVLGICLTFYGKTRKRCERLQQKAEGSSSAEEVDFVDLCEKSVRNIEDLVKRRHLLNRRQCRDLSAKVSKTILNIQDLTSYCEASGGLFRPALKNLYRYVVKAETLVRSCAEKDWCSAAVFQCQNENAFRDILLDVSLCYSVVYDHAKNARGDWIDAPEDLRRCSDLDPTSHSDVDGDVRDLQERLDDHANGYTSIGLPNLFNGWRGVHKRNLAKYLLTKMYHKLLEVQASTLNAYNPVLWTKALEPSGTWGTSCFLGVGSGATGVCRTDWLGIPCAKKEFDKEGPDELFLKEAGILAHLKHPCIVNFICCGNGLEKGERFIAMELMEKSLSNLIEDQKGVRFAPNVAIDMIVQMARGVRYLHDCGVAHRDLKPQNVVVKRVALPHIEDHYCVKLVDFGISKMKVEASKMNTMTSQGIGTTRYRAPEANPGGGKGVGVKVDWFRADAFSFAMTCVHLLSLEIPFHEIVTPFELYKEVSRNGRRPRLPDGYPEELLKLLKDCWRSIPRSRPSFKEICTRLETMKYGGAIVDEGQCGLDYIKMKMEEKLSEKSTLVVEDADKEYESQVPIHPCSCGSIPRLLHESPYKSDRVYCNICWEDCHEVFYHCGSCEFDAHPNCIELNEQVEVFFHDHPLHLLIKGYHHDKLDTTCYMCKESLQHSGWVYRCQECYFDVHALCTKYPKECMKVPEHPHPLNLIRYESRKTSLLCVCCNGEVMTNTWRYTCKSCDYDMHPHCTMVSLAPKCVFNAKGTAKGTVFNAGGTMWRAVPLRKPYERKQTWSSSLEEVDLVDLCEKSVRNIGELVQREHLLNLRQCHDLSSKVSRTIQNIRELHSYCGPSVEVLRPALINLYRHVRKAEALVTSCAEKEWCGAAVFQCQNENAFRDTLLDVSMCYNAIYEHAKCARDNWTNAPEDLRRSSVLVPASVSDVDGDNQDLKTRLDDHANGYTNSKSLDLLERWSGVPTKFLAKYLLTKMCHRPSEPHASTLDVYSPLLWPKGLEPSKTWGHSRFLGVGGGASSVCKTKWLGIPCAKKDFHEKGPGGIFMKEAGIMAHLKHPCIVNFICCGNGLEKGERFIAMELMEKSLFDLIEEQKGVCFAPNVAIDMIVQMARGVRYLHDCGVAHRDLKPQNVVVKRVALPHIEDHYCVKLVDFGISKMKVEASQLNTMTYEGIGTTRYRAPEANPLGGKGVGVKVDWFRADAFSFAMTCVHLLSLEIPFHEIVTPSELYKKVSRHGQRPMLPDGYPEELMKLLRDCWKGNPRSRPSFKEICTRLETIKYGDAIADEGQCGLDYIKKKMEEKLSEESTFVVDEEDIEYHSQVPIHPCSCGSIPRLLHESPYKSRCCKICWEVCHEVFYHCGSCNFNAHPNCIEFNEQVEVLFHDHPLHLLINSYYYDNLDTTCYMCKESLQHNGWVYQCEECDLDVHALCTKYPNERMKKLKHPHPLNLIRYESRKTSLLCVCCNGAVMTNTWRYTCKSCDYDIHPHCTMVSQHPLCVFNASHRSKLLKQQRGFFCSICGLLGFSWLYHCRRCNLDTHVECLMDMKQDDDLWSVAYEDFIQECASKKDNLKLMRMGIQLLQHIPQSDSVRGGLSSTSSTTPVPNGFTRSVQPNVRRFVASETLDLGAIDFDDVVLCNRIAYETAKRKNKQMATIASSLESKAKHLGILENLERVATNLRRLESVLQGDGALLDAGLTTLKLRKRSVENDMAMLVQSKMRHGPRTCLFYLVEWDAYESRVMNRLLTCLQADMEDVYVAALCEEPGHQHDVGGHRLVVGRYGRGEKLGEELAQKLQPLLGRGLEVVARAVSATSGHLTQLECVTLPIFRSQDRWDRWDLRGLDQEKHGKLSIEVESADTLKRAEDLAAERILDILLGLVTGKECYNELCIFKEYGLLRIRYKESEEGDCPGYTQDSVAWLCKEHVHRGLEAGILEPYPMKYYDPELN